MMSGLEPHWLAGARDALGSDPEPQRDLQRSRCTLIASILAGAVSISIYVGFIAWGLG